MAQAYHKETVIPAIDGTIEAMKPHLHMAKEQFNKGMNFAKEYTEENVMPALGETYKAVKPHLDKYTEEVYKGIDMAMGYTEESFTSAYANIKPTMDQIINTSTEHALSLFTAGKDFTSDALRPHVERAVEATKPYLRKHIATFEAYLRDFKSAVNKTVKDTVEMVCICMYADVCIYVYICAFLHMYVCMRIHLLQRNKYSSTYLLS